MKIIDITHSMCFIQHIKNCEKTRIVKTSEVFIKNSICMNAYLCSGILPFSSLCVHMSVNVHKTTIFEGSKGYLHILI